MSQTQPTVDPRIACANRATRALATEGFDQTLIRRILQKLYLGHKLEPEERKPLEVFLRHFLSCEIEAKPDKKAQQESPLLTPLLLDDASRKEVIAKILALLEEGEKSDGTSKRERRSHLLANPALSALYSQLGNGFGETAVEAGNTAKSVQKALAENAVKTAQLLDSTGAKAFKLAAGTGKTSWAALGSATAFTAKAGGATASLMVSATSFLASLALKNAREIDSIARQTRQDAGAFSQTIGLADKIVEVTPDAAVGCEYSQKELRVCERALKAGKAGALEAAVYQALLKIPNGGDRSTSPYFRYFAQKAEEDGKEAVALIEAVRHCRCRKRELYDETTAVIKAMHARAKKEEARQAAWEALEPIGFQENGKKKEKRKAA